MGSAGCFARCTALLLLLGAAFATVPGRPTVMDSRVGRLTAQSKVSVATATPPSKNVAAGQQSYGSGYGSYDSEEKEFCLMEVSRRCCHTHTVGCPKETEQEAAKKGQHPADDCDPVHSFWTSDLACCQNNHDSGYGHRSGGVSDKLWGPTPQAIASCDWTWHWVHHGYHADLAISGDTKTGDAIYKMGTANAVCFFGADADECGGPFCERMVMSLRGNVYFASKVYSYWGATETATDNDCNFNHYYAPTRTLDGFLGMYKRGSGAKDVQSGDAKTAAATEAVKAFSEHVKTSTERVKASTERVGASTESYYRDDDRDVYDDLPTYQGHAIVINGIVDKFAGHRKEKWDSGSFEAVVYYHQTGDGPVVDPIDPNTPWVHDKTYKFTFFKQGYSY